jgi:hypothetical protein
VRNCLPVAVLNGELAAAVGRLWAHEAVKDAYARRSNFQLADSAA